MSLKNWLAAIALATGVLGASSASAALINGGFEADIPGLSNPDWDVYDSIPGWTKFPGTSGIEVQRGNVGGATAVEGLNKVELDSHGGTDTNSGMSQSVALTAGSYEVTFKYLGRTDNAGTNGIHYGAQLDSAIVGSVDSTDFDPAGLAFGDITGTKAGTINGGDWTLVTFAFSIASDAAVSIGFWAGGADDTLGGYIDDVQISAVPLPPAMALFGAAMLGLGWVSRRRKSA